MNKKLLFILAFCLGYSLSFAQSTYYVKSGSNGDGSSWSSAMGNLQDAIDSASIYASEGDPALVLVAEGTYKPSLLSSSSDDRSAAFLMKNNVEIYGGFPADGDPGMEERDPAAHPSILSGDLGTEGDIADNAYKVINNNYSRDERLDSTAVLDGFFIEKGSAEGESYPYGTAIYCSYASPTIRNCNFSAEDGSMLFFSISNASMENCTMENFTGTHVINVGSGRETEYNTIVLKNCNINMNETSDFVVDLSFYSNLFVENCTFSANQYNIFNINWYTNFIIESCLFENNVADDENGAIFLLWQATNSDYYIVRNSSFVNNTTDYSGGVLYATSSDDIEFSNCLFTNNSSTDGDGGALYVYSTSCKVINCTFFNNKVPVADGELGSSILNANYFQGDLIITNSIFWGDQDEQISIVSDAPCTVNNSLVKLANSAESFPGTANMNEYPYFADTLAGDYSLKSFSPCVNSGNNDYYSGETLMEYDLAGNDRFYEDGTIDMGCYEYQGDKTVQDVREKSKIFELKLYPNPASSMLYIELRNGLTVDESFIYDLSGKLQYHAELFTGKLDISFLETGVYILEVKSGSKTFKEILIKK